MIHGARFSVHCLLMPLRGWLLLLKGAGDGGDEVHLVSVQPSSTVMAMPVAPGAAGAAVVAAKYQAEAVEQSHASEAKQALLLALKDARSVYNVRLPHACPHSKQTLVVTVQLVHKV